MKTFIPVLATILVFGTFVLVSEMNFEETKTQEIISIATKIDTPKIKIQKEDTSQIDNSQIVGERPISPRFKDGDKGYSKFLAENLKFPIRHFIRPIEGTVYVRFMVDIDGSVMKDCVKIARSVEKSLDEEAIRVVKLMPNWTPAMWNGKPIRQRMRVPIKFRYNK